MSLLRSRNAVSYALPFVRKQIYKIYGRRYGKRWNRSAINSFGSSDCGWITILPAQKDASLSYSLSLCRGKAQILIGTQMIARALIFPKVSLVGIVSADTMLQLPDYTSREKNLQFDNAGCGQSRTGYRRREVILQTYTPKHYAIADAVNYKYDDFYTREFCNA